MRKFWITTVAATALFGFSANLVRAQNPVERRLDRNLRQADRQTQRIGNRSSYYSDNTWKQVSPWISKYELQPVQRAANVAANAAANARFGYANPAAASAQTGWFYDFYSAPYASFTAGAGTNNVYSSAQIYNDTNNDGVYDDFYTYRESDNIVASGPIMQIGDKEVMMAESAQISSKEVVIARSAPKITGVVLEATSAEVQNGSHSIVVVKSDNGNRLIDLGKADQLKVKIAPQTQIVVWGVPVQMRDQSVILADKIEMNAQNYTIKRW